MALPFNEMARLVGMEPHEAQDALHRLIGEIRKGVAIHGQYRLEGVGQFQRQNGTVTFQPDPQLALYVNGPFAGLNAVPLPTAPRPAPNPPPTRPSKPAPPPPPFFADPTTFPTFEDDSEVEDDSIESREDPFFPAFEDYSQDPDTASDTEPDAFADLFDDVWDEEQPEEDPHPLGPKPPLSFEDAEFDVMRQQRLASPPPVEREPRTREEAASHADTLFTSFQRNPNAERAADTLLLAARRYEEAGMTSEAAQLYGEFIKRFPEHPQANAARRALGWMEVGPSVRPASPPTPPPSAKPPSFSISPPPPVPPPMGLGNTFEEWSPDDLDTDEEASLAKRSPAPPPRFEQPRTPPPVLPFNPGSGAPRFEMAPPSADMPLPPPPSARRDALRPPPPMVVQRRAEPKKRKQRNPVSLYVIIALIVFAALASLYFFYLRPRLEATTPRTTATPTVIEPPPPVEEPVITDSTLTTVPPDNTVAPPTPATPPLEDPLMSSQPIDPAAGGFTWAMGSYPSEAPANEAAARYRRAGFRSSVLPGTAQGRQVFRVGVGQFATQAEAEAARDLLPETPAPGGPYVRRIDS